ncbi:hypothetical protein [Nocardioides daphniae]|uniref:Uncharacterized protein n=1 Tax=Nocardioides daphniae TaxID=402297 RepID=A0A4P7UES8_9ACTN|nr:hypothetical protein [Nocardioides daphniae]QCC77868.1 hypothetical protein E2C04_12985 [Nocardioides daphniae]
MARMNGKCTRTVIPKAVPGSMSSSGASRTRGASWATTAIPTQAATTSSDASRTGPRCGSAPSVCPDRHPLRTTAHRTAAAARPPAAAASAVAMTSGGSRPGRTRKVVSSPCVQRCQAVRLETTAVTPTGISSSAASGTYASTISEATQKGNIVVRSAAARHSSIGIRVTSSYDRGATNRP